MKSWLSQSRQSLLIFSSQAELCLRDHVNPRAKKLPKALHCFSSLKLWATLNKSLWMRSPGIETYAPKRFFQRCLRDPSLYGPGWRRV